jgi:23S rRNA (guanosine2251-2'-O)-methyltransferase
MCPIIYGIHPVKEVLKSSHLQIEKILIGAQSPHPPLQSILDLAKKRKIPVTFTKKESLERLTKALFLILDGIQDPQNFGSLIRTASGCGAHGIIIPKDRAVGMTPAVVKASAGAAAHLPIARVVNIAATIEALKKEGIWVYGASGEAKDLIYQLDLDIDLAIVIGAEEKGIRPLVKKKCDRLFSIPMKGPLSSFNASVSGGMILYEVMRQRYGMGACLPKL